MGMERKSIPEENWFADAMYHLPNDRGCSLSNDGPKSAALNFYAAEFLRKTVEMGLIC